MSEANVTDSKKAPTPKKEKVKGAPKVRTGYVAVSYTHLRAHET